MKTCRVQGCDGGGRRIVGGPCGGLCTKHYQAWKAHGDPHARRSAKNASHLVARHLIAAREDEHGCLISSFRSNHGYAKFGLRNRSTSREIARMLYGEPAPGMQCRHLCGRGQHGCINPAHLAWGAAVENRADRIAHGTHGRLRPVQVQLIRRLANAWGAKTADLARSFGVTPQHIRDIVRGRVWRHVPMMGG